MSGRKEISELLGQVFAETPPVRPPAETGNALLRRLEGTGRFADLKSRAAAWLDLPEAEIEILFAAMIGDAGWLPIAGAIGDVHTLPFKAGPKHAGATETFIARQRAGTKFTHTHVGDELAFVVQGGLSDEHGVVTMRGEELFAADGTTHTPLAMDGVDCLCFVIYRPANDSAWQRHPHARPDAPVVEAGVG